MDKFILKKIFKEILLFVITISIISFVINYIRSPKINSSALEHIKGESIYGEDIESLKKSFPLVVHFWGSWCPICKQEISNIDEVAKKYNLISVAVNSGSSREIKEWLKSRNLKFPTINDQNGSIAKKLNITTFPTTLIFDKNGELKFTEVGYITTLGLIYRIKLAQ